MILVHLRACSMTQALMTSVGARRTAGKLDAGGSFNPRKCRPMDTNSVTGRARDKSTGLALIQATAPGPDRLHCRPLARFLVSVSLSRSSATGGRDDSGGRSGEASCRVVP